MATNDHLNDSLRNPLVDYDRTDLSARAILLFLVGLLVCGIFIELVLWGMFRFLGKSEGLFAQGRSSPMVASQKVPGAPPPHSVLQNTPPVNVMVFPEPRLQTNDAGDMSKFLAAEQKTLYPAQPFLDSTGAVHISIAQAMKLIEQRGLPSRPSAPPAEINTQTEAGNTKMLNVQVQGLTPAALNSGENKTEGKAPPKQQ